jgi:hypothetical protein
MRHDTDHADADDESRAEILTNPGCPSESQMTGEGSASTKDFDHSQCTMPLHDQISALADGERNFMLLGGVRRWWE